MSKATVTDLEAAIRAAQGKPQGQEWDFDVPRLQARIDDGSVWKFEGSVGRAADDALASGACFLPTCWKDGCGRDLKGVTEADRPNLKPVIRDYYGNVVPFRELLQPGTKGTLENSARFYGLS